ncbi:diacylglycerol O-acyltransferase 2 [Massarina eburnea CBS 473.64]|uniref:diacylglycerol O-acyltransferase n=1 Tax=Massarina eburnea CBS 473.64 TaxID=1395130 RepID=A0A6A6SE49_9PLEO|nr:diacylglycerol O-acyltransferase 2 [Massarina eburnea CBS 473.64]
MSLNAEPSKPEERAQHDLAPKSYADAAEEALESSRGINGHHSPALNVEPSKADERAAKHLPPKSYAAAAEEAVDDKLVNGAHDVAPKPRALESKTNGNGKIQLHKPNGSIGRKHGEVIKEDTDDDYEVYEKHEESNGHALTSVKPQDGYEKEMRIDKRPARRMSELKSGRRAGAGWHKSKIRFAPLNVPLQRRLQTLAVLMHTLSVAGLVGIFFFLCAIPILWPILLPYTIFVLFSNAGTSGQLSYRSEWCRRSRVWSLFASYFPARLHRSEVLEPTRKYIFGYHPHGIISHGAFAAFGTEALGFSQLFPGITNTLLTLEGNFKLPLYREYALRMGLGSVSRESCENILSKGGRNGEGMGRAITIVVGGARESLEARPGSMHLVLNRRQGFVKLAIRNGADLVPVIGFGENDIYEQLDPHAHPWIYKLQLLVKKLMGWTVPIFHARGIFNYDVGMLPYRRPMNIVVGRPIKVQQSKNPDKAYVDKVHKEYIDELMRVWQEHKNTFAKWRTEDLDIIE